MINTSSKLQLEKSWVNLQSKLPIWQSNFWQLVLSNCVASCNVFTTVIQI